MQPSGLLSSLSSPWLDSAADEQWHGRGWAVGRKKLKSPTGCLITSQLHRSRQSDKYVNPVKCLELWFLEEFYPEILTQVVKPPDLCKHRQRKTSHAHPLRAIHLFHSWVFNSGVLYHSYSVCHPRSLFRTPDQWFQSPARLLLVLIMNNISPITQAETWKSPQLSPSQLLSTSSSLPSKKSPKYLTYLGLFLMAPVMV